MRNKVMKINGWDFQKLIYALRQAEILVSLSDVENILFCFEKYPELDVKTIIKVNIIHSLADDELFETIWALVMCKFMENTQQEPKIDYPFEGEIAPGGQGLGRGSGGISIDRMFSRSRAQSILRAMPTDIAQFDSEEQLKWILGQLDIHQWLNSMELSYRRDEISEEEFERFVQLKVKLQKEIRRDLLSERIRKENNWATLTSEHWLYRPLEVFTLEEKTAVQQALKVLGKRLAKRSGVRKKQSVRGEVNIQRAIQELFQGKGYVFRLNYQKRVPKRTELIVLCDISNSVLPYSEFLLFLVHHMKLRFRKIRLFLFIDSLWDITQEESYTDLAQKIHAWSQRNSSGYSDYGKVLAELYEEWLPEISAHSTLLILGDGRNNYRPSQSEYLQEIQGKVNRVYWLNPLEEKDWSTPDNVLVEYEPFCSKIFRCRTIKDLQTFVRKIF